MTEIHRSDVPKGAGPSATIRCRLILFGGEPRVDIRGYLEGVAGDGFMLACDKLPALIAALQHVEAAARRNGNRK